MATITKSSAKKMLGDVPEDKRFFCGDGQVLKSLKELEVALRKMPKETFLHHSNDARNDFSNWIQDVIGDHKLADALRNNGTQLEAAKTVAGRIAWLKERVSSK